MEEALELFEETAARDDAAGGSRPRFRYVYLIWKDPWMTVGPRTYVADLLRLARGFFHSKNLGAARRTIP